MTDYADVETRTVIIRNIDELLKIKLVDQLLFLWEIAETKEYAPDGNETNWMITLRRSKSLPYYERLIALERQYSRLIRCKQDMRRRGRGRWRLLQKCTDADIGDLRIQTEMLQYFIKKQNEEPASPF